MSTFGDLSRSSPTPRLCGVLCPLDSLWTDDKKKEGQQRSSNMDNRKVEIRRSAGKELLQNLNEQAALVRYVWR
ncbi:dihydropyrimidinase-related protein 2 isoform X1 [Clarias magur]|uniref:Dihydropyrimidinase-related protein 2 isoform X1 n=1 Tax=Clarias magur TaxID=1594786 RepID=A0A8J4X7I8_CLAMG|nr:dihydropyrimidinase-related protein 2 isoform X1 [Clarias magur]